MKIIRRIGLFILTNLLVIALFSIIIKVFGLDKLYLTLNGLNLTTLAIFSFIFGFAGSFISLFLSKWMAKRSFKVKIIENPANSYEKIIHQTVQKIAQKEGIKMPEIGIYESPVPNAFATGASRNSALVAVSTGLLEQMEQGELEAVLGHEMTHVLNGDMVTMTLLQGIVNTFVIFFARIIATIISGASKKGGKSANYLVIIILEMVFGLLASLVVTAFSRFREFRADAGSVKYLGPEKMINALRKLQQVKEKGILGSNKSFAAMGIFGSMKSLLATHPPLKKRIEALQGLR